MAGTVLGKRGRSSPLLKGSQPDVNPRSRKRVQVFIHENEKENSCIIHDDVATNSEDSEQMHVDENIILSSKSTKRRDCSKRAIFSPSKIDCHFKATKSNSPLGEENKQSIDSIPQTPRHRDAASKQVPVTPRHRLLPNGWSNTPRTPRTPLTPSAGIKTVYNEARVAFSRGTNPGSLVGRVNERNELENFLSARISSLKGGCLYISGPPGTGKSALSTEVCLQMKENSAVSFAYVNCMAIKNAADIYNTLGSELNLTDDVFGDTAKSVLMSKLTQTESSKIYLVLLDEIDRLLTLDLEVLYNLFEWSLSPHSRLLLVGIANALDLTDRFLPRLKARNLKPTLLPFLPYTAPEIASVLSGRTRSLLPPGSKASQTFTPFLLPPAIQLISKKVAAQTGDIRKAFDITKRTIDLVEAEVRTKFASEIASEAIISPSRVPLGENMNLSSPPSMDTSPKRRAQTQCATLTSRLLELTAETAPRATIAHVVRVTASAFSNGTSQRLKGLNLQQKAVLCSLIALQQSKMRAGATSMPSPATPRKGNPVTPSKRTGETLTASAAPTLRKLYEVYSMLCKRDDKLHALPNTEFRDVVGSLEALSLVTATDGKAGSIAMPSTPSKKGRGGGFGASVVDDRRVSGCVGFQELDAALEGVSSEILKGILHSEDFS